MSAGNINDTYFDGHYKQIWKAVIPEELTVKETDFIVSYFELKEGAKVLDLMCGYGRHAIALSNKGIAVTAVDNSKDYIAEIEAQVGATNPLVKAIQADVSTYTTTETFDLVMCMGNSLNFFSAADVLTILKMAASSLKAGGNLLINSWSVAEIIYKNFKEKGWSEIEGFKFLNDSRILFHPSRMETNSIIIAKDGTTETKMAIDYIYSLNEMEQMFQLVGLKVKEYYSIPGRKKFTVGEPRLYIVAEKI